MKKAPIYLLLLPIFVFAQKHDNHWINNYPFIAGNSIHFDFSASPPTIYTEAIPIPIYITNVTMSDAEGNLLFYSNGIQVRNSADELIENGDSLNWCELTKDNIDIGLFTPYMLCLPAPGNNSVFYLINPVIDYDTFGVMLYSAKDILYSTINMVANNGQGKVVDKNQVTVQVG
jgi:hypothetical protein